jgi:hypothetical protein
MLLANIGYSQKLLSQNQMSNWFFADSIWIKFTEDTFEVGSLPVVDANATNRNYVIISDSLGNLLFYKDSYYAYNKYGSIMNIDFDINSYVWPGSSIIIPTQKLLTPYYILSLDDDYSQLSYCIVQFDSIENKYFMNEIACNIFLDADSTGYGSSRLTVVKHGNGRDWWVVNKIHSLIDSLQPFSVRLFDGNVFAEPELSYVDSILEPEYFQHGQILFNEKGDKFAMENGKTIRLYSFDRCSGAIYPECHINSLESKGLVSIAFSQNGNYLYAATDGGDAGSPDWVSRIWQFDVNESTNCEALEDSRQLVYEEEEPYDNWVILSMLLERHSGRIYFSADRRWMTLGDDTITGPQNLHLHAIMDPNMPGALSNAQENVIYLNGMRYSNEGLPNMPNYALGALQGSPCDTIDTANAIVEPLLPTFQAYPNPVNSQLYISNPFNTNYPAVVCNLQGQVICNLDVHPGSNFVDAAYWPNGCYSLQILIENQTVFRTTLINFK